MKKTWKLFSLVCLALFALCIVSGCGGGSKIHAPFEDSYCRGKDLDSVVSQLQDAGFTNIETDPQDTLTSFNANDVISVKIGSNTSWNTANAWAPDVKIVVKYYEFTGEETPELLNASIDIETYGEDGKPQFVINTNLPDGTILAVELSLDGLPQEGQDDYFEQRELTVSGGTAETETFTCGGESLIGDYRFYVSMLPSEQPEDVLETIGGEAGSNLSGPLVEYVGTSKYVATSITYTSPYKSENSSQQEFLSLGDAYLAIGMSLSIGFGNNYALSQDENTITATVWEDGVAMNATLAALGNSENLDVWNDLVDGTRSAAESCQSILNNSGHSDIAFIMQIANDLDESHDTVLLAVSLGTVFYDYVNGIDLLG